MRIWHEKLIPCLCRSHLLACWREGLGVYSIITNNRTGYRSHPAVKEWEKAPCSLYERLDKIRNEMLKRGYNPKCLEVPKLYLKYAWLGNYEVVKEWQTLNEQIQVLKSKGCECKLDGFSA